VKISRIFDKYAHFPAEFHAFNILDIVEKQGTSLCQGFCKRNKQGV
jgi:hypothetical protein